MLTLQKLIVKTCYPNYQSFLEECEEVGLDALRAAVKVEEPKWAAKNAEAEEGFSDQLAIWSEFAVPTGIIVFCRDLALTVQKKGIRM